MANTQLKVCGINFQEDNDRYRLCEAGAEMRVFLRSDIKFIQDHHLTYSEIFHYRNHIFDLEDKEVSYKEIKVRKEKYRKRLLERKNAS